MNDQTAGLRIEFEDNTDTAKKRIDDYVNNTIKKSDTMVRAIDAAAKRMGRTWQEQAEAMAKFSLGLDKLSERQKKNDAANDNSAKANEKSRKATEEHGESLKKLHKIVEELGDAFKNFAGRGPAATSLLLGLGPAGVAAAAGITAVALALNYMDKEATRLGKYAGELQNLANATGLTTTQLQALQSAGVEVGLSYEQTGAAVLRFSSGLAQLRQGTGQLYDNLLKISPELADQLSVTTDMTEAINILAKAYKNADKERGNALLNRGLGLRGTDAAAFGALLKEIEDYEGIDELAADVDKLDQLTEEQVKRWSELKKKIEDASATAQNNIASIFTEKVLESQLQFNEGMVEISRTLKEWSLSPDAEKYIDFLTNPVILGALSGAAVGALGGSLFAGIGALPGAVAGGIAGAAAGATVKGTMDFGVSQQDQNARVAHLEEVNKAFRDLVAEQEKAARAAAKHRKEVDEENQSIGVKAQRLNDLVSGLGSAATAQETYNAKVATINKLLEEGRLRSPEEAKRAEAGAALDRDNQLLASRIGYLGQAVPLEDQLAQKRLALQKAQMEGARLSKDEIANQERLIREQYNGVAAAQAQTDAARVQTETIGMSVGASTAYSIVQSKVNEQLRLGVPLSEEQTNALRAQAIEAGKAAQANAARAAQDKATFDLQTVFLSDIERSIANVQRSLHGDMWQKFMSDGLSATMRLADTFKSLRDNASAFAVGFVRDLSNGIPAIKAFENALKNLAANVLDSSVKKLVDSALSALSGALQGAAQGSGLFAGAQAGGNAIVAASVTAAANLAGGGATAATSIMAGSLEGATTVVFGGEGAGLSLLTAGEGTALALEAGGIAAGLAINGPVVALVAAIAAVAALLGFSFGGDDNSLEQAQKRWRDMTDEVAAFNRQADGFDLGPLTSQLISLGQAHESLVMAALEARDLAGVNRAHETYNRGISRIFETFVNGTSTLTELQQAQQNVVNEWRGLKEEMHAIGRLSAEVAAALDASLNRQLAELAANARKLANERLNEQINQLSGKGYINEITQAFREANEALAEGADNFIVQNFLKLKLQSVVNEAQLTGEAFAQLAAMFPGLTNYVHEYSAALDEAAEAAAAAAAAQEKASLQLRLLTATTDQNTLAGALAVNALRQQIELNEAIANKSRNIDLLKQVQAAETYAIIKSFADKQVEAERQAAERRKQVLERAQQDYNAFVRRITDFIAHYLSGPESGLLPAVQLSNAQTNFSTQLALAQGGNRDALNSITGYFSDLEKAAKAQFGSTEAGQNIISAALAQLQALPAQVSPEQFIVDAIVEQTQDLAAEFDALRTIVATGDATSVAAALVAQFDRLVNPTTGLLKQDQLETKLNLPTGSLSKIFAELDNNGDGILEKEELMKKALLGTQLGPLTDTETNTDETADNTAELEAVRQATAALAAQSQLNALIDIATGIGLNANSPRSLGGITQSIDDYIKRIYLQQREQNLAWGQQFLQALPTYMQGGFTGYGSGIVGGVHAQEFVMRASSTSSLGLDALNYMNQTGSVPPSFVAANDNRDVVAAIDRLTNRIGEMEDRLVRVEAASAAAIAGQLSGVEENTRRTARIMERRQ